MAELNQEQFDAVAELIRSRENTRLAAHQVLVQGYSNSQVLATSGLSAQSLSNTLMRFRRAHEKLQAAYRGSGKAKR